MTEQEAIKWQESFKKTYNGFPPEVNEACDMAIKALEKQVPKKPKEKFVEVEIYNSGGFTRKEARKFCPVCKAGLSHEHFCYGCGQKLD